MLKILFVSSGNFSMGFSPIIKAHAESLTKKGINIDYFELRNNELFRVTKYLNINIL